MRKLTKSDLWDHTKDKKETVLQKGGTIPSTECDQSHNFFLVDVIVIIIIIIIIIIIFIIIIINFIIVNLIISYS